MLCSLYMLKRFKKIKTCRKDEKQRKTQRNTQKKKQKTTKAMGEMQRVE